MTNAVVNINNIKTQVYESMFSCACMCLCVYIYIYVCFCVCVYIYIYIYTLMHLYICVCVCFPGSWSRWQGECFIPSVQSNTIITVPVSALQSRSCDPWNLLTRGDPGEISTSGHVWQHHSNAWAHQMIRPTCMYASIQSLDFLIAMQYAAQQYHVRVVPVLNQATRHIPGPDMRTFKCTYQQHIVLYYG